MVIADDLFNVHKEEDAMTNVPKLGGYRPDVPDSADYKFEDLAPKLALTEGTFAGVDLRKWCSPIENQSYLSSCVGNAVVGALELLQIKNGVPFNDLSRLFVYYNSRMMHKEQDQDAGTYIRLAMGTLSSLGACSESKWPYDPSTVFTRPTWGSYREAYANKIQNYYRIGGTGQQRVDMIKRALEAGNPVVFGVMVDDAFMNTPKDGVVAMPKSPRTAAGGHAMLIVGYDNTTSTFIVRNSWGTSWGDKGYCYMPYDYIDSAYGDDFWVATGLG